MSAIELLDRDALLSIASTSREFLRRADPRTTPHSPAPSQRPPIDLPSQFLSPPQSIISLLTSKGISRHVSERLSEAFLQYATRLKTKIEDQIHVVVASWAQHDHGNDRRQELLNLYSFIYDATLRHWVDSLVAKWRQSTGTATNAGSPPPGTPDSDKRGAFKDALPILEKAFDEQPYPTTPARVRLAEETGMTPRQIQVWFQNRRNRWRKGGHVFKRALYGHVSGQEAVMEFSEFQRASSETKHSPVTDESILHLPLTTDSLRPSEKPDPFPWSSPDHAFPSAYPPACPLEPAPLSGQLPWSRQAAKHTSIRASPNTSIDDLISLFAGLSVHDPSVYESRTPSRTRPLSMSSAASCGFTITPPRAPLPCLVRATVTVKNVPRSPSTAGDSYTFVHRLEGHDLTDITKSRQRSKAEPRSIPCHSRDNSTSVESRSPFASSRSCSSSSVSSTSTSLSASSSISTSSSADSPPHTPPHLPSPLVEVFAARPKEYDSTKSPITPAFTPLCV